MSEHHAGETGLPLELDEIDRLLATLDDQPVEAHVAVYDQVHRCLRDHLGSASGTSQSTG